MSTASTADGDVNINLKIHERPEGTLVSAFLGMEPYLLVTVKDAEEDEVSFTLEVGGGVPARPLDELAAFFEGLAEVIRDGMETSASDTDDEDEDADDDTEDEA